MAHRPLLKNLARFLLILNIVLVFNGICFFLLSPQIAKAKTKLETTPAENECSAHPVSPLNLKFKADRNQLLPCCFEPARESDQTGSLAGSNALELLQMAKVSGAVTPASADAVSSYFYSLPAPPPELSYLTSVVIRV